MTAPPPVRVEFSERRNWLEAVVSGTGGNLENTIGYWRRIHAESLRTGAKRLLVIDRQHGGTLGREQIEAFYESFRRRIPPGMRLAVVVRDGRLIPQLEYGALLGRDDGLETGLFNDRISAEIWLRYGGE